MTRRALAVFVLLSVVACIGEVAPAPVVSADGPSVDVAHPLAGVPDRGDDPGVVALDVAGQGWCAGVLLAPDAVLTAGGCAPPAAQSVRVLAGDTLSTAVERARGLDVLRAPRGDGVAVVLLDASIDDVAPLPVRKTGAAAGGHVRTAGYAGGVRIVRDHVPVLATSERAFDAAEVACEALAGSPALDEGTGAIVGILTSAVPNCVSRSGRDVYARADDALPLIAEALARGRRSVSKGAQKTRKGPIDMGAACTVGADCAAGACVTYASAQYCSRTCGPHDPCPTHFKCMSTETPAGAGAMACIER
jgi:hypothetical protein